VFFFFQRLFFESGEPKKEGERREEITRSRYSDDPKTTTNVVHRKTTIFSSQKTERELPTTVQSRRTLSFETKRGGTRNEMKKNSIVLQGVEFIGRVEDSVDFTK